MSHPHHVTKLSYHITFKSHHMTSISRSSFLYHIDIMPYHFGGVVSNLDHHIAITSYTLRPYHNREHRYYVASFCLTSHSIRPYQVHTTHITPYMMSYHTDVTSHHCSNTTSCTYHTKITRHLTTTSRHTPLI